MTFSAGPAMLTNSCDPKIGVQGQIVFVALRRIAAGGNS
jgi:hypothetical protein